MLDTLFLVTAAAGGTVMVCQFLLTVLGMGDTDAEFGDADVGDFSADADMDFEVDGDHQTTIHQAADADVDHPDSSLLFQIISFRTVVAALTFFGLSGAWSSSSGHNPSVSLIIAAAGGFAAMFGMYRLMKAIHGFQSSGNVDIRNAVGQPATVYVPIPAAGAGKGKVHVTLQGRTMEYEAIADLEEVLKTGEDVVVEKIIGSDVIKVAKA